MDSVNFHVPTALIKARSRLIAQKMSRAHGADTATGHITQASLEISYAASAFSMYLQLLYGDRVVVCQQDDSHASALSWTNRFELFRLTVDLQDSLSVNLVIDDMIDSLQQQNPDIAVLQCLFGDAIHDHRGWETPRKIFVDHAVHKWGDDWLDAVKHLDCYVKFSVEVIKGFVAQRDRGMPASEDYYQYF